MTDIDFKVLVKQKLSNSIADIDNRNIVLWGAGHGGRLVLDALKEMKVDVDHFIDKDYKALCTVEGCKVLSLESYNSDNEYLIISFMTPNDAADKLIYSTFLQRAYDQILHDVCLQKLHVVFAIDRAGLVGNDGETHQGIYDISYLSTIPGLMIMSPKNKAELISMLRFAVKEYDGPVAIRYPRGTAECGMTEYAAPLVPYENEVMKKGKNIAVISTGCMVSEALKLTEKLSADGMNPSLVNIRFLDRVDSELLKKLSNDHGIIVSMEENVFTGSFTERMMAESARLGLFFTFVPVTLPDRYVEQGSIPELRRRYGLDADNVYTRLKRAMNRN